MTEGTDAQEAIGRTGSVDAGSLEIPTASPSSTTLTLEMGVETAAVITAMFVGANGRVERGEMVEPVASMIVRASEEFGREFAYALVRKAKEMANTGG